MQGIVPTPPQYGSERWKYCEGQDTLPLPDDHSMADIGIHGEFACKRVFTDSSSVNLPQKVF